MTQRLLAFLALLTLGFAPLAAHAQQTAKVVTACGAQSYSVGGTNYITIDINGNQCSVGGPGPTSAASAAIVSVVSAAAESSHVLKASAGNLYRLAVTTGATAGFLLVVNAAAAPSNGVVTPLLCRQIAANSSLEVDHAALPDRYGTGITALFSSTGCFTLTLSATAMFEGAVQ